VRKSPASLLSTLILALASPIVLAQLAKPVEELVQTFNDETIAFNDKMVVLGKPDAKVTAVVIYGLSVETTYFMNAMFPDVRRRYIDSGKVRVIVFDFPLSWHDMQALAGLRCLPAEKHFEAMHEAVRSERLAHGMRHDTFMNAPRYFVPLLRRFGLDDAKAQQCMRNLRIIGHIEAARKLATEQWNISFAPTLIIGGEKLVNPSSLGVVTEFLDKHVAK
jgi:hypothetical protein